MKYGFGVDLGGTTVKIAYFDETGNMLDKWEIPTVTADGGKQILPDIAASVAGYRKDHNIPDEALLGLGIGVPGPVDASGTVNRCVNLGWGVLNIPQILREYLDVPVKAANDANVAALGEMWQGGGKGHRNMVAVTLGTGVGGGIIVEGKILTGATGAGGEIGHIHMEDNETELCGCKKKGCLEQYASATGIVRLAKRRLAEDDKPSCLREGEISAKTVFDGVKAGDEVAIEIAERFGNYLGKGLAMVACTVNPEVFVIGGGVSKAGEILLSFIKPSFEKYVFSPCKKVEFALAKLGNDAGIYGAAKLVL